MPKEDKHNLLGRVSAFHHLGSCVSVKLFFPFVSFLMYIKYLTVELALAVVTGCNNDGKL